MATYAFSPRTETGRTLSLRPAWSTEFQDSHCYTETPGLINKKKKDKHELKACYRKHSPVMACHTTHITVQWGAWRQSHRCTVERAHRRACTQQFLCTQLLCFKQLHSWVYHLKIISQTGQFFKQLLTKLRKPLMIPYKKWHGVSHWIARNQVLCSIPLNSWVSSKYWSWEVIWSISWQVSECTLGAPTTTQMHKEPTELSSSGAWDRKQEFWLLNSLKQARWTSSTPAIQKPVTKKQNQVWVNPCHLCSSAVWITLAGRWQKTEIKPPAPELRELRPTRLLVLVTQQLDSKLGPCASLWACTPCFFHHTSIFWLEFGQGHVIRTPATQCQVSKLASSGESIFLWTQRNQLT